MNSNQGESNIVSTIVTISRENLISNKSKVIVTECDETSIINMDKVLTLILNSIVKQ